MFDVWKSVLNDIEKSVSSSNFSTWFNGISLISMDGGKVIIGTIDRKTYNEIIIEDDGRGFNPENFDKDTQVHVGMENVKQRLKMMCGGTIEIESEKGKGTVVTIKLPKKQMKSTN